MASSSSVSNAMIQSLMSMDYSVYGADSKSVTKNYMDKLMSVGNVVANDNKNLEQYLGKGADTSQVSKALDEFKKTVGGGGLGAFLTSSESSMGDKAQAEFMKSMDVSALLDATPSVDFIGLINNGFQIDMTTTDYSAMFGADGKAQGALANVAGADAISGTAADIAKKNGFNSTYAQDSQNLLASFNQSMAQMRQGAEANMGAMMGMNASQSQPTNIAATFTQGASQSLNTNIAANLTQGASQNFNTNIAANLTQGASQNFNTNIASNLTQGASQNFNTNIASMFTQGASQNPNSNIASMFTQGMSTHVNQAVSADPAHFAANATKYQQASDRATAIGRSGNYSSLYQAPNASATEIKNAYSNFIQSYMTKMGVGDDEMKNIMSYYGPSLDNYASAMTSYNNQFTSTMPNSFNMMTNLVDDVTTDAVKHGDIGSYVAGVKAKG